MKKKILILYAIVLLFLIVTLIGVGSSNIAEEEINKKCLDDCNNCIDQCNSSNQCNTQRNENCDGTGTCSQNNQRVRNCESKSDCSSSCNN